LWRDPIKELAHQLHALTDQLGEHHDLAALAQKVAEDYTAFSHSTRRGVPLKLIKSSQCELQRKSVSLGTLIYCEKPARFAARIGVYWHAWRRSEERRVG